MTISRTLLCLISLALLACAAEGDLPEDDLEDVAELESGLTQSDAQARYCALDCPRTNSRICRFLERRFELTGCEPEAEEPAPPDAPLPPNACCADGTCLCRGADPTVASASATGPFRVQQYTQGFRDGPAFGAATIYLPVDAAPPFAGIVMCPGFTARQSSIAAWGPFFASHGIVLMTIDTNSTNDPVNVRDDALLDALTSLRAEGTRVGSPLFGKLSADRFGVSGWSMGGGGAWLAAAARRDLKTSMAMAGHDASAGGARIATGTAVPSILFAGGQDSATLGGGGQSQGVFEIIPASTPKLLFEMADEGHFSWGNPRTNNSALARYALAFQKVFLEGDERFRPFLLQVGPNASDFRSNLQ
jgi:dienelactone hydrolase